MVVPRCLNGMVLFRSILKSPCLAGAMAMLCAIFERCWKNTVADRSFCIRVHSIPFFRHEICHPSVQDLFFFHIAHSWTLRSICGGVQQDRIHPGCQATRVNGGYFCRALYLMCLALPCKALSCCICNYLRLFGSRKQSVRLVAERGCLT